MTSSGRLNRVSEKTRSDQLNKRKSLPSGTGTLLNGVELLCSWWLSKLVELAACRAGRRLEASLLVLLSEFTKLVA